LAKSIEEPKRHLAARAFTIVEDVVYLGLGVLLAGSAIVLLISGLVSFVQNLLARTMLTNIVPLLDQLLLILLVIELLYTVQVSFREHVLKAEPFLLVGLIAAIRRVLVLTAQFAELKDEVDLVFRHLIIELGVLTFLIVALVVSLVLLRKIGVPAVAERAT
jgi:uncharacterized membrane protein (DUF373 family)